MADSEVFLSYLIFQMRRIAADRLDRRTTERLRLLIEEIDERACKLARDRLPS